MLLLNSVHVCVYCTFCACFITPFTFWLPYMRQIIWCFWVVLQMGDALKGFISVLLFFNFCRHLCLWWFDLWWGCSQHWWLNQQPLSLPCFTTAISSQEIWTWSVWSGPNSSIGKTTCFISLSTSWGVSGSYLPHRNSPSPSCGFLVWFFCCRRELGEGR